MDKKLTDLEKKTIMEALPQMMAGLRVGGNVTCDELSRAGSDQTSQQGKSSTGDRLRRLNARFHRQWLESCDNRPGMAFVPASEDTLVPVGAMFAFFDDELSRAGGERAVLPPGAPVTNEELEREMSAEYKAWIVDGRNCGFGVPMEEAKRLAEIVVGLRRELVAAKSARGERAGSPNKVSDLLHGGELRSISDAWERYLAYCEELPLDKQQKAGHEAKLLVDAVTAALHSQLAAIEAARAKAMEGAAPDLDSSVEALRFHGKYVGCGLPVRVVLGELDRTHAVIASLQSELATLRAVTGEAQGLQREVEELRAQLDPFKDWPTVLQFARVMVDKLKANKHKGGWDDCDTSWLIERMLQEVGELAAVCKKYKVDDRSVPSDASAEISREAADVANFAMMVADKCGLSDLDRKRGAR